MTDWTTLTASEVMSSPLITVRPGDTLEQALRTLTDNNISGTVVSTESGDPLGVLSLFDLVQQLASLDRPLAHPGSFYSQRLMALDESGQSWERNVGQLEDDVLQEVVASDMMTAEIVSVPATAPLQEVATAMAERKIHRVLVAEESGRLVGIITALDLVTAMHGGGASA